MPDRVKFVCQNCNKPIFSYKSETSTRRKCSCCGSYHVKSTGSGENSQSTASSSENSQNVGISVMSEQANKFVSIVIVNYNGKPYLNSCLDAISKLKYPKDNFEVIVIDNCSEDGSLSYLSANYPWVSAMPCPENNYCKANNQGIRISKGEFVVLLNNDTIVDPDWLGELVNTMNKHPDAGAVGSKVLFESGLIQSTGHQEYPNFEWGDRGYNEKDTGQYEKEEEVESLCGVSLMLRKECLDKIGLLDEDFVFYMEDVDLALRMRKEGWKLYYSPKSKLVHKYNGTGKILHPKKSNTIERQYTERNRLLFVAKHYPDKISDAISSFPYFYIDKDFSVIYDSIPLLIETLFKYYPAGDVIWILKPFFDNIKKITKLERSSFVKDVAVLNEKINNLNSRVSELLFENASITSGFNSERTSLSSEVSHLSSDLHRVSAERDSFLSERNSLLSVRDSLLSDVSCLSSDLELSSAEVNRLLAYNSSLLSDVSRLSSDLVNVSAERDSFLSERNSLLSVRDSLLSDVSCLSSDLELSSAEVNRLLAYNSSLLSDVSRLSSDLVNVSAERDSFLSERNSLLSVRDSLLSDVSCLSSDLELSSAEVNRLLAYNSSLLSDVSRLSSDLVNVSSERDSLFVERGSLLSVRDSLLSDVSCLSSDLELSSAEVNRLLAYNSNLSSERDSLSVERDSLLSERDSLLSVRDSLLSDVSRLSSDLDNVSSERDSLSVERDSLLSTRDALLSERSSLSSNLKNAFDENNRLLAYNSSLLSEKESFLSKIESQSAEVTNLNSKVHDLSVKFHDSLQKSFEEKEKIMRDLRETKAKLESMLHEKEDLSKNKTLVEKRNEQLDLKIIRLNDDVARLRIELDELANKKMISEQELKDQIAAKEKELSQAGEEIVRKEDALNSIQNTKLYKHVCTPIWKIHNSVKGKNKVKEQSEIKASKVN